MLRTTALHALAEAVRSGGDDQVAYAYLRRVDPLLRWVARRRLRREIRRAILMTDPNSGTDDRHVLRLAFLALADSLPAEADDAADVERAYDGISQRLGPARRTFWWPSAAVLTLLLGSSIFAVVSSYLEEGTRKKTRTPFPVGAYARGGRTTTADPVLDKAFGKDLPDFLIALDRLRRAKKKFFSEESIRPFEKDLDAKAGRLEDPETAKRLGSSAAFGLQNLIRAARYGASSSSVRRSSDMITNAVNALNAELMAAGLPYYLDGDLLIHRSGERLVIMYVFHVTWVTRFKASHHTVRALRLRRLDSLNWSHSLLGYTRPEINEALVLLDQVDELLVTYIAPGLGIGEIPLFDEKSGSEDGSWQKAVSRRAAAVLRMELSTSAGVSGDDCRKLGYLLHRRQKIIEGLHSALKSRGIHFDPPTTMRMEADLRRSLQQYASPHSLAELDAVNLSLSAPSVSRTFDRLHESLVVSVERHEAQHRLDHDLGLLKKQPHRLSILTGPLYSVAGPNRFAERSRSEFSAYLSELHRDTKTCLTNLTLLSRFLFNRRLWGSVECHAAMAIIEELAEHLKISYGGPLLSKGEIARERLARLYLDLTARPAAEIRRAAREIWERSLGSELLPLERVDPASPGKPEKDHEPADGSMPGSNAAFSRGDDR